MATRDTTILNVQKELKERKDKLSKWVLDRNYKTNLRQDLFHDLPVNLRVLKLNELKKVHVMSSLFVGVTPPITTTSGYSYDDLTDDIIKLINEKEYDKEVAYIDKMYNELHSLLSQETQKDLRVEELVTGLKERYGKEA